MKNKIHIPVLDSLRASAALSVCLFHFVCTVTGFISNTSVLSIFSWGHYGVQMFFVISGFIIPWSMFHSGYKVNNFFTFTLKRLIRLEPPYLISLFFAILHTYIRTLSPHYNGLDITPSAKQIMLHFGYLIPFFHGQHWIRPVYWTLAIEFQYYLFIGLVFQLLISKLSIYRYFFYILCLVGPLLPNSTFLPYHLPIFLIGILLFMQKANVISQIEMFIVAIVSFILIFTFFDNGTLFFTLFAFIAIFYFPNFKSRLGTFLGEISYSIYLFHSLTGLVILNYFSHNIHSPLLKIVLLIVAILTSIFSAYIVYRVVEKPSKKFSSKIKYKQKEEA